jgi:hypothetical protein
MIWPHTRACSKKGTGSRRASLLMGSPMVYPMVLCVRMDVNDGKRRERRSEQDSREIITSEAATKEQPHYAKSGRV